MQDTPELRVRWRRVQMASMQMGLALGVFEAEGVFTHREANKITSRIDRLLLAWQERTRPTPEVPK